MAALGRYEIVDTIASGDFATVYRGRDRELGREVAIKQIHQQFLSDPRQLERYWREAQLLASLQHPSILTIYDIVRPRGWLILELMRSNLERRIQAGPIELDTLRTLLAQSLGALEFLHLNGIIHGDVKPSNLLLDAQNRVKLGDFGLARRASSEQGSLLKGTTKYMAPELIASQFGAVGPASDLYSLGFAAYELMCGPQFETLFPGLATFGRDRQIAWLMWHAAADRNLPEIGRVLEGVPEDIARVVGRMVVKDQARRYRSAQEALRDLRTDAASLGPAESAENETISADDRKKKRLLRAGAIAALCCSLALSVVMLLPPAPPPPQAEEPKPLLGTVRQIYLAEHKLVIERADDSRPEEIEIKAADEVFVNDKKQLPRDLRPGDRVKIEHFRNPEGMRVARIAATRAQSDQGRIKAVDANQGQLTVLAGAEERPLLIAVPATLPIRFNGRDQLEGKPVKLADLASDDRVSVSHVGGETGRVATELSAERVVSVEGVIRDVDLKKGELTLARGEGPAAKLETWPLDAKCEVTVNDRRILNQQVLKPGDLKPGDKATMAHDSRVVRVHAYRVLGDVGIVQAVRYDANILEVLLEGQNQPTQYLVGAKCKLTLAGDAAQLADLRAGDRVDITHDSPGTKTPEALAIDARRPADSGRWALLVAVQALDDRSLSPLTHTTADARLLQETLIKRYGVPEGQTQLLADASQVRIEQGVPDVLGRVKPEDKLVFYLAGHAYRAEDGKVYYAPKNYNARQPSSSGIPLQWFVDQLEKCPAKEKLFLLDCTNAGSGPDLAAQPSGAEMIQSLNAPPGFGPLRSLTAIASSSPGQRAHEWPGKQRGLFAGLLAQGYAGEADKNRDKRLEPTELFAYLAQGMGAAAAQIGQSQTPALILPDTRKPRLSEEAKQAIRTLAGLLREEQVDSAAVAKAYAAAEQLAGKELEPRLLYGLLLLKAKQRSEAGAHFERLRTEKPALAIPLAALAWLRFSSRAHQAGIDELAQLAARGKAKDKTAPAVDLRPVLSWMGQLREFAGSVQDTKPVAESSLQRLDGAVAALGEEAQKAYEQGRARTRKVSGDFDRQLDEAPDEASKLKLRVDRRQLPYYASFPFDEWAQRILSGLDLAPGSEPPL